MNEIGAIIKSSQCLIPPEAQADLVSELGVSTTLEASPAGAILMGMYVLEYVGFPRYVDELLGEPHTTIEELRDYYHHKAPGEEPMLPSTGIILSLMVADMVACPRNITRTYKFQEKAEEWRTGPLLGIEPDVLNDDRILRRMDDLGLETQTMHEILFKLVMDACGKAEIPLNKFILDTTTLELSGEFKDAPKVTPGRGQNSFSQLLVSLIIASGSKLPAGFGVLAGKTNDSTTLPDAYHQINRIADEGAIEMLMDRIYPTAGNIRFLEEHRQERMVYWVAPLKMGLSRREVRAQVDNAYRDELWKPISYRSTKEKKAKIAPPLTAFETTWTLKDVIKPELEPGQKRRPRGSIQTVEIEVRCVFYRHELAAQREQERRNSEKERLEEALQGFCLKLNQRRFRELDYCRKKLAELLKPFSRVRKFLQYNLSQTDRGIISLTWVWDDNAMEEEEKYDGIFALITNYLTQQVNTNQLLAKYRSRDQIEVDFKEMKGLLDLERIFYHLPDRIDVYIFLKVIAFFVLAFLRTYAAQEGVKTTEKKIQESMGDMLLVENKIMPLELKVYGVARDTELNRLFRQTFGLPDPLKLIKVLSEAEIAQVDNYVLQWYEKWSKTGRSP